MHQNCHFGVPCQTSRFPARVRLACHCLVGLWVACWLAAAPRADAAINTFIASPMNCANVVPCNTCAAAGIGHGVFNLDTVTGLVRYYVTFSGMGSNESAKHIHGPAANCATGALLFTLPSGSAVWGTYGPIASVTQMNQNQHYIDIHSDAQPNGHLRARITRNIAGTIVGSCCLANGATCLVTTQSMCSTLGGVYGGDNTSCTNPGACCTGTGTCTIVDSAACCLAQGGSYGGDGSTCTSSGACCLPDGTCQALHPTCCAARGGTYNGDGTNCNAEAGACCLGNGDCVMVPSAACCTSQGGVYSGDGTNCNSEIGACCLGNGDCVMVPSAACCTSQGGVYGGNGSNCNGDAGGCCIGGPCEIIEAASLCCGLRGGWAAGPTCDPPVACRFHPWTQRSCELLDPDCCLGLGGRLECNQTDCTHPTRLCCFGNDNCIDADPSCCVSLGGTPGYSGSRCSWDQARGCCVNGSPVSIGTTPCCSLFGHQEFDVHYCSTHEGVCVTATGFCFRACESCCIPGGGICFYPLGSCEFGQCSVRACCLPNGGCINTTSNYCGSLGGTPSAEGIRCGGGLVDDTVRTWACRGDMYWDKGIVDGGDIQEFVNCFMLLGCACGDPNCATVACPEYCAAADMDFNNKLDCNDIGLFVQKLLTDANTACP